jgi:hypothetical protein
MLAGAPNRTRVAKTCKRKWRNNYKLMNMSSGIKWTSLCSEFCFTNPNLTVVTTDIVNGISQIQRREYIMSKYGMGRPGYLQYNPFRLQHVQSLQYKSEAIWTNSLHTAAIFPNASRQLSVTPSSRSSLHHVTEKSIFMSAGMNVVFTCLPR